MVMLKLTAEQAGYLEAALEKAMDNENDSEYYGQYSDIAELLLAAQGKSYA